MGIGVSVLLIAVGAVLAFAVHVASSGFNLHDIGYILMAVGALGLLTALMVGGVGSWGGYRRTRVVDDAAGRRVVDDRYVA